MRLNARALCIGKYFTQFNEKGVFRLIERFYVSYVQKYHERIWKPSEGQQIANKGIPEQKYRTDSRNCDKIAVPCEKLFIILIVFLCFNVEGTP